MRSLEKFNQRVNGVLAWAAGLALIAMMLFTVADMALRALGRPVAGSYEIIGWLSAAAMALALGYTQVHRGHVAIDLLATRLRGRTRAAIELATCLDRKSTRLNSSHVKISYAVFCLKKKKSEENNEK